jgi:hypothetical protein
MLLPPAVGGPSLVSGAGWDPAPLVLMLMLVALMRWATIPLRATTLLAAVGGGLLIDLATDTFDVSSFTASSLLILSFAFVALWRIPPHRPPA